MQILGALDDALFQPLMIGEALGNDAAALDEQHDDQQQRRGAEAGGSGGGPGAAIERGKGGEGDQLPAMLGQAQFLQDEIARSIRIVA
ncbi:hypothetical protein D3C87_1922060 [compost metagenome]